MIIETLKKVLADEKKAIALTAEQLNQKQAEAVEAIIACQGKVVFLGVGKSGHIAEKLAATFASTGTPSFFVHGTEACHGDLGMIESQDIVVAISNSGTTKEVVQCIEPIKRIGAAIIGFTSNPSSPVAENADYLLLYPQLEEADGLGLAPTCSSTAALALGDAVACAVCREKGFTKSDFLKFHPNGALGNKLRKDIAK